MPLRFAALAVMLALALPGNGADADAVVVTRAMTASTIVEAFVEAGTIAVELEIGEAETDAFTDLLDAAEALPAPIPREAGFSIEADGARLTGTLERVVRRKRIERDEISGEPLPRPGTEDVVFVELRYRLRSQPTTLELRPPLNEDGYPAADIGFVIYHEGIALNDFRYLADGEPIRLDWEDPFYSRFERRTLRRKYDSPMNVFVYVEPFEVRKELVVRPLDVARFAGLPLEPHQPIPPDAREPLLDALGRFLSTRAPLTIDGQRVEPILDRIHFLERGLRMTRVVPPEEPIDSTSAIVGAIFVYPVEGMPNDVRMTWDLFDARVQRVPAAATDEAGPMPYFLTPDDPEVHWVNYLKGTALPGELEVEVLRSNVSVSGALLIGLALALLSAVLAWRRRSIAWTSVAVAALGVGALAPPLFSLEIPVPPSVRTPSQNEAAPTIHALLHNAYRALDFRDEEVVFDRLANSLSGDILERAYLEMRRGLRLENQGGARVRVRNVSLLDVVPQEPIDPSTVRYRARWKVAGSVGHWGHTHIRTNAYDALLTLAELDGRWKIAELEILEELRLPTGTR